MKCLFTFPLILSLTFFANATWAHHSVNYHFDPDTSHEIEGLVKEFHFRNPHSALILDVTEPDGSVTQWDVEMVARATLIKQGWTDQQFLPGQLVKVSGFLARRSDTGLYLREAEFVNGTSTSFDYGRLAQTEDLGAANQGEPTNLSPLGNWVRAIERADSNSIDQGNPGDIDPRLAKLTERGAIAAANYDPTTDDPSIKCVLPSIIRVWGQPDYSPTNISQQGDLVTIHHEMFDVVRRVHLGQSEMPTDYQANVLGYSKGRYEGDTLVIETSGFSEGVLLPHPGVPQSDQLIVVERLSVDPNSGAMRMEWTATDPLYYSTPQTGRSIYVRSDIPVGVFDCEY